MTMEKQHKKLSLEEREQISIFKASGKSLREIARLLGRSHSTLSRELKRNAIPAFKRKIYLPSKAHLIAWERKIDAGKKPRLKDQRIRDYVEQKIKLHWAPEQIAGRIPIDQQELKISHEAIYQYIYQERWDLSRFLPRKRKRRRLRFNWRKPQCKIPQRTFINDRPEIINQRLQFGHWEADSAVSRANLVALHVLYERKSRLIKITKISRNSSDCVQRCVTRRLNPLPKPARLSITYDNGTENTDHLEINRELKTASYFCNPYHSWEKGGVENSIGLVRRFIPKKTDLQRVPTTEITRIENLLNNRPRKCLNYRTPKEVFNTLNGAIPG